MVIPAFARVLYINFNKQYFFILLLRIDTVGFGDSTEITSQTD